MVEIFLESSNAKNNRWYKQHGFESLFDRHVELPDTASASTRTNALLRVFNKPPLKRGTRGINYLMRYKGKGYDRCTHFKWWFVTGVFIHSRFNTYRVSRVTRPSADDCLPSSSRAREWRASTTPPPLRCGLRYRLSPPNPTRKVSQITD